MGRQVEERILAAYNLVKGGLKRCNMEEGGVAVKAYTVGQGHIRIDVLGEEPVEEE